MQKSEPEKKNVIIISDLDGKHIALINDIRFRSRRSIDWNIIEGYLKEYIGKHYEIFEILKRFI